MQDTKKDFTKSDLSIFISYMLPHKKLFALDMFLSALIAFIDLSFPYITRKAMNSLLPQKLYVAFFTVMAAVLTAYLLRAFFQYKVTVIGHGYGTLVEADMRSDVFAHMQRLSFSFFDKNRTGVLFDKSEEDRLRHVGAAVPDRIQFLETRRTGQRKDMRLVLKPYRKADRVGRMRCAENKRRALVAQPARQGERRQIDDGV